MVFQVLWAVTADAGEVKTWEPEAQLVEDGWGPDIKVFEATQVASSKQTKAAARQAAASSCTKAAAQQEGSAAPRKRSRLLKELAARCYCEAWGPHKGCRRDFTELDG